MQSLDKSKSLAGIVGPTLVVMVASELKIWNPHLYDEQIIPLVYLSGVMLFVAGLAIIRKHNIWVYGWQSWITLVGWLAMLLGLVRMVFPAMYQANVRNDTAAGVVEGMLILLGLFLTYKAYWPLKKRAGKN
jgi:hypothetical protein